MKQLIRFVLRHVPRRYIQRVVHLCTPLVGLFYAGEPGAVPGVRQPLPEIHALRIRQFA